MNAPTYIVVEECISPLKKTEGKKKKTWVGKLTEEDRAVLTHDKWVTDTIIDESQKLLRKQFPHISGFQSVVLGETMSYDIETEEFIQILHTRHGHWVTASTIGCQEGEIYIFGSIPPAPTAHLVNQIAALLATQRSSIQLKYVDTTMQCGSTDCGLFAIAFAVALANGDQPGGLQFTQTNLQKHLLQCFKTQYLTPFLLHEKGQGPRE